MNPRTVLITGAAGNMGRKLRAHLAGRYDLRLIDRVAPDPAVAAADLSTWGDWHHQFRNVDVVFHFAAEPEAYKPWPDLIGPNVDALIHTYQAAALGRACRRPSPRSPATSGSARPRWAGCSPRSRSGTPCSRRRPGGRGVPRRGPRAVRLYAGRRAGAGRRDQLSASRLGAAVALPLLGWLVYAIGWRWFRGDPAQHPRLSTAEREMILRTRQQTSPQTARLPVGALFGSANRAATYSEAASTALAPAPAGYFPFCTISSSFALIAATRSGCRAGGGAGYYFFRIGIVFG